jgi:hypothetical protein
MRSSVVILLIISVLAIVSVRYLDLIPACGRDKVDISFSRRATEVIGTQPDFCYLGS